MRELTTVSLMITSRALIFDQINTVEPTFTLSYALIDLISDQRLQSNCLTKGVDDGLWVSIILKKILEK